MDPEGDSPRLRGDLSLGDPRRAWPVTTSDVHERLLTPVVSQDEVFAA